MADTEDSQQHSSNDIEYVALYDNYTLWARVNS